jgi:hypothetical protein
MEYPETAHAEHTNDNIQRFGYAVAIIATRITLHKHVLGKLFVNIASLICPRISRGRAINMPAHKTCWNPNIEGVVRLPGNGGEGGCGSSA